jgi:hypothetical protein
MAGKAETPQFTPEQDKFLELRTIADAKAIDRGAGYKNGILLFTKEQKRTARLEMVNYQAYYLEDTIIDHVKKAPDETQRATRLKALSDLSILKYREAFVGDDEFTITQKDVDDTRLEVDNRKDADPVYKDEYDAMSLLVTCYEQKQCGGKSPILTQKQFYWNLETVDLRIKRFPKELLGSIPQQPQTPTQK